MRGSRWFVATGVVPLLALALASGCGRTPPAAADFPERNAGTADAVEAGVDAGTSIEAAAASPTSATAAPFTSAQACARVAALPEVAKAGIETHVTAMADEADGAGGGAAAR